MGIHNIFYIIMRIYPLSIMSLYKWYYHIVGYIMYICKIFHIYISMKYGILSPIFMYILDDIYIYIYGWYNGIIGFLGFWKTIYRFTLWEIWFGNVSLGHRKIWVDLPWQFTGVGKCPNVPHHPTTKGI